MNELPAWLDRGPVPWTGEVRRVLKFSDETPSVRRMILTPEIRAKMSAAAKARCKRSIEGTAIGRVLAFIQKHPGIRTRDIVIAGIKKHTITNALSELHTQGKVRREGDPWKWKYFPQG